MRNRLERIARIAVASVWIGGLGLVLRLGIAASDPAEVLGLLIAVYLGIWGLTFFLRPASTTLNAARFLMVTIAIGMGIFAFEVPALIGRIDYRDVFHTPTAAWRRHYHKPDPDLIYVREGNIREHRTFIGGELAGLSGVGKWAVYDADIRYDAQGFRNPVALERADVVVVGDSFVEGLHVKDNELMTTKLAKLTGLSVANLGRSGDGPQQERLVLERFGMPKRPKVVIWVFYEGNDLEDAGEYEANRTAVAALGPISSSRVLYERSFTRNALMFARRAWIAPTKSRQATHYRGSLATKDGSEATMTFASEDHRRGCDPSKLAKCVSEIREASELCRKNDTRLILAFVPTKLRVYRDFCRFPQSSSLSDTSLNHVPIALRRELESRGASVEFLDLTPNLRQHAGKGELAYFPDDTHWTATGHAISAVAIGDALSKNISYRGSAKAGASVDLMSARR